MLLLYLLLMYIDVYRSTYTLCDTAALGICPFRRILVLLMSKHNEHEDEEDDGCGVAEWR